MFVTALIAANTGERQAIRPIPYFLVTRFLPSLRWPGGRHLRRLGMGRFPYTIAP
jgi:hypothetical protein